MATGTFWVKLLKWVVTLEYHLIAKAVKNKNNLYLYLRDKLEEIF